MSAFPVKAQVCGQVQPCGHLQAILLQECSSGWTDVTGSLSTWSPVYMRFICINYMVLLPSSRQLLAQILLDCAGKAGSH